MIIDDKHKFVFIHIPKCAGTSVRHILDKYDTCGNKFRSIVDNHPQLGRIDFTHLPLDILHNYYAEEYLKIINYNSIAIVRNPFDRFPSSLYQHIGMYSKKNVKSITQKDIKKVINEVIEFLSCNQRNNFLPYEYIHFQRQKSYIFFENVQIVKHVFTTKNINDLFKYIFNIIQDPELKKYSLHVPHVSKSTYYRYTLVEKLAPMFSKLWPYLSKPTQSILPNSFKEKIKTIIYTNKDKKFKNLFESEYVVSFINEYYMDDINLFRSID